MALKFNWSGPAMDYTYRARDHYARDAIKAELEADPLRNAVKIDPALNLYANMVLNYRYAVVWQLDPVENMVSVKFVLPFSFRPDSDPAELKGRLGRALEAVTQGSVTMHGLGLAPEPSAALPSPAQPKHKPFTL